MSFSRGHQGVLGYQVSPYPRKSAPAAFFNWEKGFSCIFSFFEPHVALHARSTEKFIGVLFGPKLGLKKNVVPFAPWILRVKKNYQFFFCFFFAQ